MKKLLLLPVLLLSLSAWAQKKPLDHDVYDSWQSVGTTALSPSGRFLTYEVTAQAGDGTLYIRDFGRRPGEIVIPRGYSCRILDDERHAVCLVKPLYDETRQARIDGKKAADMPQDSLAVIDLTTGSITRFPNIKSYKAARHGSERIAFETTDTTCVTKEDQKAGGSTLLIYTLADGHVDTLRRIESYAVSEDGRAIGYVQLAEKKKSLLGFFRDGAAVTLPDTAAWRKAPVFDRAGTRALYVQADDTLDSGSKHVSLYLYDIQRGESRRLAGPTPEGLPAGWGLTENSTFSFSRDGSRIFTSVQEALPPKDTTLVSFELPSLDIWVWNAPEIPPYMKANLNAARTRTFPCLYRDGKLVLLNASPYGRLQQTAWQDGPYALATEPLDPVETQWNITNDMAVYRVAVETGERAKLAEGSFDTPRLSPEGRYAAWWDYAASRWLLCELATARISPVEVPAILWDEDNDSPVRPDAYGIAGWTAGDDAVLLYDRYDIWKVSTADGTAERLTRGRESGRTYRYMSTKDSEERASIRPDETVFLSVFDHATKENGIASLNMARPAKTFRTLQFGGYSFAGLQKAAKADVFTYRKGNFRDPMDVWYTASFGRSDVKCSAINPQIADYNWGTAELYRWHAYDGTPLEGLLFKPEDFDAAKQYPVMIYFYERNSETLYSHRAVAPSASTVNIPFYVSRGYVVFVPDVVYAPGIPGESAYNCIVSGAESLKQHPWIDGAHMAIQGQSWGGYQVAYLITRTGMFAAAGAGAPVSNMTSAYGGIRWESGMSRQFQYEQTQSRIGRDLWHGLGLYLENSPVFMLPEVTTPVLIMHNDADGAVPWYQGIELFMGLRRLGKPAWLLEYNEEAHNLVERRNRKDLSIRLQQFFDHYLKGAPEPAWMKNGVPALKKDYYFGYETD